MEGNTIGGMTLYGLGSKARLYCVCAAGQADVVADGNIENSLIDEVQEEENFKESELIKSLYDPRILKIIKNPENPQILGKEWRTLGKPTAKTKSYILDGKKNPTGNYINLDFAHNKITLSLASNYIFQEVEMQFTPNDIKLLPETVRETFTEN